MPESGTSSDSGNHQKRRRVNSASRLSSLADSAEKPPPPPHSRSIRHNATTFLFHDESTADVILYLYLENSDVDSEDQHIYLHSDVLSRSEYFAALLSDRWQREAEAIVRVSLPVSPVTGTIDYHLTVIKLLYSDDFSGVINTVSVALSLLPVALELLFEDCVKACVKFLEAVPWTEDEEKMVISLIPLLKHEESHDLVARVSPVAVNSSEDMLYELLVVAMQNHSNMAFAKAFVAKLLRDYSCKESARRVLDRLFLKTLKEVKFSLEEYSRPDFRSELYETEAIQRLHLHTAMKSARNVLWIVERMIELGVAHTAVVEWTNQDSLTMDLQRAIRDGVWRTIVPALPHLVLRCTLKLANAVVSGSLLAEKKVRMKLVEDWLPVLRVCKEKISATISNYKTLYLELEEAFLKITSTLPMSDSQKLLKECICLSTPNVDDCPHLVTAFNTWFRRAKHTPTPAQPLENPP